MMHAVEHDQRGRIFLLVRKVQAAANVTGLDVQRYILGRDRLRDNFTDQRRHRLTRDLIQNGDGLEMLLGKRPDGKQENEQTGDKHCIESNVLGYVPSRTLDYLAWLSRLFSQPLKHPSARHAGNGF